MLVPPALINGSGMPLVGSTTVTTPDIDGGLNRDRITMPAATIRPNRSRQRSATRHHSGNAKTMNRDNHHTPAGQSHFLGDNRENKIGRVFRQMAVLDNALAQPLPHRPPVLMAISDWRAWYGTGPPYRENR